MTDWKNITADELRERTANNPNGEDLAGMTKEEKAEMWAAVRRINQEEQEKNNDHEHYQMMQRVNGPGFPWIYVTCVVAAGVLLAIYVF